MEACKNHGLIVGKGGLYGNALRIAPPLTATADHMQEALESLTRALKEVAKTV
jgi:4-aminobutyrate aminotransferase-like enzyme